MYEINSADEKDLESILKGIPPQRSLGKIIEDNLKDMKKTQLARKIVISRAIL